MLRLRSAEAAQAVIRKTNVSNKNKMSTTQTYKQPNEQGYYGKFGGAYIPEMLYPNVQELQSRYLEIMYEPSFRKEYEELLRDYVFEERSKEFFMEMRRREDLFRWGKSTDGNPLSKFKEKVKPTLDDPSKYSDVVDYTVYPYPQKEIDANTSLDESINIGRVRS